MHNSAVFSLISQLFVEQDQDTYEELTSYTNWQDFLSSESLDTALIQALEKPLTYEEHASFCRKHFVGGLPCSAMPVESLYEHSIHASKQGATYLNSSAQYMKDLISSMGLNLPQEFHAFPDHLSLECDMYAMLCEAHLTDEASTFLHERFVWLESYRQHLETLSDESASFFCNLISVLINSINCN